MTNKIIITVICAVIVFVTGTNAQRAGRKRVNPKAQSVRVEVIEGGYRPGSFRLKKGVPARLTFIRRAEDECGKEVVFPAYDIRRELPLNRAVTIAFTPRKAGSFSFACGMDMMRGKMIIQ